MLLTRDDVRTVECPACRAEAGGPCHDHGRERLPHHVERIVAAEAFWNWRILWARTESQRLQRKGH
jgi:hypothetical protein